MQKKINKKKANKSYRLSNKIVSCMKKKKTPLIAIHPWNSNNFASIVVYWLAPRTGGYVTTDEDIAYFSLGIWKNWAGSDMGGSFLITRFHSMRRCKANSQKRNSLKVLPSCDTKKHNVNSMARYVQSWYTKSHRVNSVSRYLQRGNSSTSIVW